jgi:hypothetical protein
VPNEVDCVARVIGKLGGPEGLRVCYEAGPCGYGLYWQLVGLWPARRWRRRWFRCVLGIG